MPNLQIQSDTPQFRSEAVKLVLMQRLTLHEAAKRLKISQGTLNHWALRARKGSAADLEAAGGVNS